MGGLFQGFREWWNDPGNWNVEIWIGKPVIDSMVGRCRIWLIEYVNGGRDQKIWLTPLETSGGPFLASCLTNIDRTTARNVRYRKEAACGG
jgi:hypothetical protein